MSDIQNTKPEKNHPPGEETAEDKKTSQEIPGKETIESAQSGAQTEKEKGFLSEAAENIEEGAKIVGGKAAELTDRVVDKLKKGWSQAYDAGAKVVDELSQSAHEYAEKYKAESEIKKLKGKKDLLMTQLGHSVFKRHRVEGRVTESFFNDKEIIEQFTQIENFDRQIIDIGKQLDSAKK